MVSTPTTRLRIEKQSLGSNLNVWGDSKLNDALERIDEAVGGVQAITISGTATTLTSTNYATDQARKAALVLTGTLSANSTITVPNVEKLYLVVNNATQGAYSLTLKTAAGSGYALRGGPQWVYCDATDVYRATGRLDQLPAPTAAVDLNSQKITGLGTPTLGTDAVTKTYADAGDTAISAAVAASATAAASSATAASGSASSAATSAAASSTSATASATSATNSATSATASATSATASAGSATAAAASAASIIGGPVTSVNALTGVVVLGVADISGAAPLASPTLTGTPAAPTASAATSTTQLATTAFVTTADNLKANLASPTFTGTVTAPAITGTLTGNASTATLLASGADRTKLDGIATGATANSSDATLLARANHTGTQTATTSLTMSTARLLGRSTASTGAAEEITVGSGLTLSAGSLTATGGVADTLSISYTGTPLIDLPLRVAAPGAWSWRTIASSTPVATGKTVLNLSGTESSLPGGLTTLTFTDLAAILQACQSVAYASLTSLSFPALTFVGEAFGPSNMPVLTTFSTPVLATVGGAFAPSTMAALTTLSFPALTYVGVQFAPTTMAALTTLSTPVLATVGQALTLLTMASLTTLSFPALTFIGSTITIGTMAALTSFTLPAIVTIGGGISITSGVGALATMTLGSTLKSVAGNVNITSAALNQASVDNILVRLAALDGTGGTTAFSTPRTVTITGTSSTPSATGLTAKATLVARGVTVTHN